MGGFLSSVKKKDFAPVYFFYGDESFLIEECVDAILASAVDPSMKEFNLDIVQGSEIDAKKLISIASAYPMMAERRVVVVKDFERIVKKESEEMLVQYVEHPSSTTVLILIANTPDFRKKPYITLKKHAHYGELRSLYDNETLAWIESRIKKMKRSVEEQAVILLHSYVGNSLRELANEIEKLMIAVGERTMITAKDVEHVVGVSKEFTVFELANKVGEKNIKKSLEIADRLINSGESAVPIIAALTTHFVRLWKLHDGIRQRKSEEELLHYVYFNRFALKTSLAQARNYKAEEIENAFVILADADLAVKSSVDPKLVLTKALTEIILSVHQPVVAAGL